MQKFTLQIIGSIASATGSERFSSNLLTFLLLYRLFCTILRVLPYKERKV
jgi:hypothetical protein